MIRRHSHIPHPAYFDLLASLKDEAVADLRGTATRFERKGKICCHERFRVGSEVRKTSIGEDSDLIRARLARHSELGLRRAEARASRARPIRILRAEGFLGVDASTGALLNAFAGAGVFRLGGTVVGTQAFRLYEGELGLRYAFDQTAQTRDIDIASFERLSLALDDEASPSLQSLLKDFAFEASPQVERAGAWRWRHTRSLQAVKDRAQAAFLIEALAEDRPDDLAAAYDDAVARGPRWRERLAATLARMSATRARLTGSEVPASSPDGGRDA